LGVRTQGVMTPTFQLGRDFCTMHLPQFYHPVFTHLEFIVLTNKQTHKQTDAAENTQRSSQHYDIGWWNSLYLERRLLKAEETYSTFRRRPKTHLNLALTTGLVTGLTDCDGSSKPKVKSQLSTVPVIKVSYLHMRFHQFPRHRMIDSVHTYNTN